MRLSVENGCFAYDAKHGPQVLSNIDFSVEQGEILAILGPNGAGKTTLLRCIMGFLQWTQGDSLLDGRPLRGIPSHELWQKLAYVPQARGKASGTLVEDMVLLGRASRIGTFHRPGRADRAKAEAVLEQLDLLALRGRRCDEISGGELQMVLIARALAAEPACVILDEPESNLDFKNQLIVLNTLEELRAAGIACVFNTHYPEHALRCADKALLLDKHGTHQFGAAAEVVTEQSLAAAFGVRSVIGEVETDGHVYRDVLAVSILNEDATLPAATPKTDRSLAAVTVLVDETADVTLVNRHIHAYGEYVTGRFGMPSHTHGVRVITLVLDAPENSVRVLTQRLAAVQGVRVKAVYALDGTH